MPALSLRSTASSRRMTALEMCAAQLDSASTSDEIQAALAGLLAADPARGDRVTPLRRRFAIGSTDSTTETVPEAVEKVLQRMDTPAYVQGRLLDVLVANPLARALTPFFEPGSNLALSTFLSASAPQREEEWDEALRAMVRQLLDQAARHPRDSSLHHLVGELTVRSGTFARLWVEEEPAAPRSMTTEWKHPVLGQLTLRREKALVGGSEGMMLVLYRAAPGSISEVALDLLRTVAPSQR